MINININGQGSSVFKWKFKYLLFHRCFIRLETDFGILIFDVFGRFYLREMIPHPVSITPIAFKDKIMGF